MLYRFYGKHHAWSNGEIGGGAWLTSTGDGASVSRWRGRQGVHAVAADHRPVGSRLPARPEDRPRRAVRGKD